MGMGVTGDPFHQTKGQYPQGTYYQQQIGQQVRKNSKNQNTGMRNDQDYNYIINLEKYGGSSGPHTGPSNNPLLASVHTQGSLKANETAPNGTSTSGGNRGKFGKAGSGASQGSHGGSGIISKKETKNSNATAIASLGHPTQNSNNRVGSIN